MRIRLLAFTTLVLIAVGAIAARQNGSDLYQQGLARETAGDLKGAMQIFERIVRDVSADRALTAKALVQLGRWSDLLGEDQARKYYERVIREFADQKDAAAEARARLDALTRAAAPATSPARRLIVDHKRGAAYMAPTQDGRHFLRYNKQERAFELVEIGTGAVRRLTADGPNPAQGVFSFELSRDGRRLAAIVGLGTLQAPAGLELRVFDVGGRGTGRVLATWGVKQLNTVQVFAWAPRDDRIWLFLQRGRSAQIASVGMGSKLEVLKTLTWRDDGQAPSLSPDGRFLAYHDAPDRQVPPDIYLLATDGTREHRVEHPAHDSKPMFLPDGSGVVFESNRRDASDLWFQAVAEGRPAGRPRLVWRDVQPFGPAERFADTGSLFFHTYVDDSPAYAVALDLDKETESIGELTRLAPANDERNRGAVYSADGRYLAHFRGNGARIVVRELASGLEREIPFEAPGVTRADWCASGDALIAKGYSGGIGEVAYRVTVKDASVQRLPITPARYHPALCVGAGADIIYIPAKPVSEPDSIVRRSLATGWETTLFTGVVALDSLGRSMDGKRLAFITRPAGGRYGLVTLSAEGGDISADLLASASPEEMTYKAVWMPSGDRILAVRSTRSSTNEMPFALWDVPLTGAAPRRLGLLPVPNFRGGYGVSGMRVQPDGKRLEFQFHEGLVEQTWAIDNLFQFIKAGGGR